MPGSEIRQQRRLSRSEKYADKNEPCFHRAVGEYATLFNEKRFDDGLPNLVAGGVHVQPIGNENPRLWISVLVEHGVPNVYESRCLLPGAETGDPSICRDEFAAHRPSAWAGLHRHVCDGNIGHTPSNHIEQGFEPIQHLIRRQLRITGKVVLTAVDNDLFRLVREYDFVGISDHVGQARPAERTIQDRVAWEVIGNIAPSGKGRAANK